jgi:hypothetical protein
MVNIQALIDDAKSFETIRAMRWPRGCGAPNAAPRRSPRTSGTTCLFGLYSLAAVLYHALPEAKRTGAIAWPGKAAVTFSDALTSVRRWLWGECVFPQAGCDGGLEKVPRPLRELLLAALVPAA